MKKRIPFFLILSLCLSGCGLLGIPKAYEEGTGETLPKFRMEEKTFHYPETVTVSYPDGTSACTEYLYKDAVGADRLVYKHCTGLIYYENDQEISREDWEPDAQGNPVMADDMGYCYVEHTYNDFPKIVIPLQFIFTFT